MRVKRERERRPAPVEKPVKKERDFEWPIALVAGAGVLLILGALVAVLPGWLNQEPLSTPAASSMTPSATPTPASAPPPAAAPAPAPSDADTPPDRSLTRERPPARGAAAQSAPVTKTSSSAPASAKANTQPTQEALCSSILHKASLGEVLNSEERKIIVACK